MRLTKYLCHYLRTFITAKINLLKQYSLSSLFLVKTKKIPATIINISIIHFSVK